MLSADKTARLVIADDHDLARAGLREMLVDEPSVEVVGEASTGREAIDLCGRLRPDLVLMDVRMPRMDGLAATRAIKREHPGISILVLTVHEDSDYLLEALKAGAAGYVLKEADRDELISTVLRVLSGESPLDPGLVVSLLKRLIDEGDEAQGRATAPSEPAGWSHAAPLGLLTPRELEVLGLLAQGHTNRQIAQILAITTATVKRHVENIITKMGVSDRTQAAMRAYELKLITTPGR